MTTRTQPSLNFVTSVGENVISTFQYVKNFILILGVFLLSVPSILTPRHKITRQLFFKEFFKIGPGNLLLVATLSVLLGGGLTIISIVQFKNYGFHLYAVSAITIMLTRQVCPVLVAIVLLFNAGIKYTIKPYMSHADNKRELIEYYFVPLILVLGLVTPLLYTYAAAISISSGYLVSTYILGISPVNYADKVFATIDHANVTASLLKTLTFGVMIGLVTCHNNIKTLAKEYKPRQAVKYTLWQSIFLILLSNAVVEYMLIHTHL